MYRRVNTVIKLHFRADSTQSLRTYETNNKIDNFKGTVSKSEEIKFA